MRFSTTNVSGSQPPAVTSFQKRGSWDGTTLNDWPPAESRSTSEPTPESPQVDHLSGVDCSSDVQCELMWDESPSLCDRSSHLSEENAHQNTMNVGSLNEVRAVVAADAADEELTRKRL